MRPLAFSLITITLLIILSTSAQAQSDPRNKLVGNWAGESICTGKRPACKDEKVVYRIRLNPNNSASVTIQADKISRANPKTWEHSISFTIQGPILWRVISVEGAYMDCFNLALREISSKVY